MAAQNVTSIPVCCRFGELSVVSTASETEPSSPILQAEEPFTLQTSVEFLDASAVALLALEPTIYVEFYAKPCGPGEQVLLGDTRVTATSDQRTYSLSLFSCSPVEAGFNTGGVYRLGVLLRVGAEEGPGLICAVQEDVLVQIHGKQPKTSVDRQKKTKKS
jgi:hypothetical protein